MYRVRNGYDRVNYRVCDKVYIEDLKGPWHGYAHTGVHEERVLPIDGVTFVRGLTDIEGNTHFTGTGRVQNVAADGKSFKKDTVSFAGEIELDGKCFISIQFKNKLCSHHYASYADNKFTPIQNGNLGIYLERVDGSTQLSLPKPKPKPFPFPHPESEMVSEVLEVSEVSEGQ